MSGEFVAHIRLEADGRRVVQSVSAHCENTARYAQECLSAAGLSNTAFLAGLHHDDGKRTAAFQAYIHAAAAGIPVQRGSVVHSFTGTRFILEAFHGAEPCRNLTAELIAYAIGAHHGLFDCLDPDGRSGFTHRLKRPDIGYEEAIQNLQRSRPVLEETNARFSLAAAEISAVIGKLTTLISPEKPDELSFYFGMLARLVASGVIEGDRRDTMEFMKGCCPPLRPDWSALLAFLEKKLRSFPSDTPIALARQKISQLCRDSGEQPGGVYRLNVPTGAGKTLSSLRYGLAHAARWKKSRIIFTSPLLSILEQNAAVLREYIGDSRLILEHHSNVVLEKTGGDELDPNELLAESWSAPVIITSLVQLLNTLFSGKTQSVRRFQSLCNSVIVIDEVQTVPLKMLSLFDLAVNFLAVVCNATVVLCSATQPCLEEVPHSICVPIANIVPYSQALWAPFRRTALVDAGSLKLDEIPDFARQLLAQANSLLIVCNKKDEAVQITRALADLGCFHLSAAMCPAHRRNTLAQLQSLLGKEKVVCTSTQVIEAGVDISFDCVIRLTAGMDNVIQAAGRCNRNGEKPAPQPVYLLSCSNENLSRLPEIQQAKNAVAALLDRFHREPERYDANLSGDQAIADYYRKLYENMPDGYQDFVPRNGGPSLYELLSENIPCQRETQENFLLQQAFRTAGKQFQVFDEDTVSVLVPFERGRELIAQFHSARAETDFGYVQSLVEQAKPYLINLYQFQFDALERNRALGRDPSGRIFYLKDGWYDAQTGLITQQKENCFLEV
ncbi:MAG: CRISPR-associated helicase Cas3' [Eubacteriales bacterium]|nr:CRISPR-associated helicase Cas3' [Eubacteriales bacterium]